MGNAKKEDAVKDRKGPNSIRNETQKAKSRVAAKNRRKNENENIEQLTRLVPWIPNNPPDKSTIIRLSTSYIGLKQVLNGSRNGLMIGNGCSATQGIENHSLEVLDGFVIILAKDGTVIFVSEKVINFLGFPPHELMGKKIYNFVLRKDWELLAKKLRGPLPSMDNPNIKELPDDPEDVICEPDASELFVPFFKPSNWNEKTQFSLRIQCNVVKRASSSKSTGFQIIRFTGKITTDGYFTGTGEHAWSPDVGDLPVYEPAFMSRLTADLKLLFCEGRIHRYMDSEAKDIVGRNVYPFYHPTDIFHIQKMHSKLLAEGKVTTVPYRWMNRDGGWVWLKSTTTRVHDEKTGKSHMMCVNWVLSAIENKGVVMGINPETKEKVIERKCEKENENDSNDAYLVDSLTEALTRSHPFGTPACPGNEVQDDQENVPNVFNNFSQNKPQQPSSLTSQENVAKPREKFYSQNGITLRDQIEDFENFPWPQAEHTWPAEETKWPQNNFTGLHNNQQGFDLQDLIINGQFSSDFLLPTHGGSVYNHGNIYDVDEAEAIQAEAQQLKYIEEQYKRNCLEESFKQQSQDLTSLEHMKAEPAEDMLPDEICNVMADQFEMADLFRDDNQEDKAYEASLYLIMNELPVLNPKLHETTTTEFNKQPPATIYNHQRQKNSFSQAMVIDNQPPQCYTNFSQMNHNNNILSSGIANLTEITNSCLLDFDQSLLN